MKRKTALSPGWFFISPWLIGFIGLTVIPFAMCLYLSLCKYDLISPPTWIGLANYKRMLFADPLFWHSIYNTLFYAALAIPLSLFTGVGISLLLNLNLRGMSIYRTIFFLPAIVPMVATSILWLWILNPQIGLVNALLAWLGIPGPTWLGSPEWSKPSFILMTIWSVGGSMVIYLAGLKDIPVTMYEAALIDGSTPWHRLRFITLPMLSPVIFFNLVMGIISALQYFTQAYIMTMGGPEDSSLFFALYIFNRTWAYLDVGYASAMAWILFVITLAVTVVMIRYQHKWVHYER